MYAFAAKHRAHSTEPTVTIGIAGGDFSAPGSNIGRHGIIAARNHDDSLHGRLNETIACCGDLYAARLVDMAMQKEAGQTKGRRQAISIRSDHGSARQKRRQRQHLIRPWQASRTADGPPAFRRNKSQILTYASGGAFGQIEAKTEVVQDSEFEAHEKLAGIGRVLQVFQDDIECIVEMRVRITLRQ